MRRVWLHRSTDLLEFSLNSLFLVTISRFDTQYIDRKTDRKTPAITTITTLAGPLPVLHLRLHELIYSIQLDITSSNKGKLCRHFLQFGLRCAHNLLYVPIFIV